MTSKEKPPTGEDRGPYSSDTRDLEHTAEGGDRQGLAYLAGLRIWLPHGKSKAPCGVCDDGIVRHLTDWGNPDKWLTRAEAEQLAASTGLSGVGIVIDKTTVVNGQRLNAIDVDLIVGYRKADPEKGITAVTFDPVADADEVRQLVPLIGQIDTYWEAGPSCTGVHALFWAPETWAAQYGNTGKFYPGGCDHAEYYTGEAPTYITVTGQLLGTCTTVGALSEGVQAYLAPQLTPVVKAGPAASMPEILDGGSPINLAALPWLSVDQRHLVEGTGKINRSNILLGLLIKLIDSNISQEDILASIIKTEPLWKMCDEHWKGKAEAYARSQIKVAYPKSNTGKREALIGFNENWKPAEPKKSVAFPPPFPGPMADAVSAALDAAYKRQPELTTMAALSGMAACCGSFYQLPDGARLNLYCLAIAPTGCGKDLPLRLAQQIGRLGGAKVIGAPGSGQGLEDALLSNVATFCTIDEIAHVFSAMNDAKASGYEQATARKLLELFSASSSVYETRALAGKTARTIQNPALNLVGFTTPEKLGNAFSPDDFADGLAGRNLFVFTDSNPTPKRVRNPIELPDSFKKTAKQVEQGIFQVLLNGGVVINIADDADALIDVLLIEFDQHSRNVDSPYAAALCIRSLEKVERIAGVLAVWDNPAKPVIECRHIEWAARFVRASNTAVLDFVSEFLHGGDEQEHAAKLLRMIRDGETKSRSTNEKAAANAGWTPRSALLRRSKMDAQSFDRAIRLLCERREIKVGTFEQTGLQIIGLSGDE